MSSSSSSTNSSSSSSSSTLPTVAQIRDAIKDKVDSVLDDPAKTAKDAIVDAAADALASKFKDDTGSTMSSLQHDAIKDLFGDLWDDGKAAAKSAKDAAADSYPFTNVSALPTGSELIATPTMSLSLGPITWTNPQNSLSVNWGSFVNSVVSGNYSKINPANNIGASFIWTDGNLSLELSGHFTQGVSTTSGSGTSDFSAWLKFRISFP